MAGLTAAAFAQALVVGVGDSGFHWTPATVVLAIFLFFLAGLCEIGGGWLVWQVMALSRTYSSFSAFPVTRCRGA